MEINQLAINDTAPMDLLLLADPSEEMILSYLRRGICFIAKWEHETVGVYVLLETRPNTAEIVNIAVATAHQGKGVGKTLILHAIRLAKNLGYHTLEIGTGNSSIHQLALYQKCGFRLNYIEHNYFSKHYKEKIMENGIHCVDMIRLTMDLNDIS